MLLLLFACHVATVSECVTDVREIDDDEALEHLPVTVADVVAAVGGVRTFDAALEDGTVTTAELDLQRTDAPAVLLVRTTESHEELKLGLFEDRTLVYYSCDDLLSIPFALDLATTDLATTDGGIDVSGEVNVTRSPRGNERGVGVVEIRSAVEPSGDVEVLFDDEGLFHLELVEGGDAVLSFYAEAAR